VTAAVDAIEYQRPAVLSADMTCQGQVVFTGGSSLDIRMELLQVGDQVNDPNLTSILPHVCKRVAGPGCCVHLTMCVGLSAEASCQGQVVYTGGSSLDMRMELLQVNIQPRLIIDHRYYGSCLQGCCWAWAVLTWRVRGRWCTLGAAPWIYAWSCCRWDYNLHHLHLIDAVAHV
jgi:hypothetical protein